MLCSYFAKRYDYTYDEKTKGVQLTEEGINKAERGFKYREFI